MDPRPILVAVDGSRCSAAALKVAHGLATAGGAPLVLLHVLTGKGTAEAERLALYGAARGITPDQYALREGEQLVERTRDSAGIKEGEVRLEVGLPGRTILKVAAAISADTIVLGTHGRGWLGALTLGSVSREVMAGSDAPVVAVHVPAKESPEP